MKKKKRIYSPMPPPWRKRVGELTAIVDDCQWQIEKVIGWRKKYSKYFAFSIDLTRRSDKDIEALIALMRCSCPDLQSIEAINIDTPAAMFQSKLIRGHIAGERPKLKRVKI